MNRDAMKAWCQALQVGEKVAVNSGSYGIARYSIGTVVRLTATQAIVRTFYEREQRFRREDGQEVGGGSSYGRANTIEPLTDRILGTIEKATLCEWIAGLTRNHGVSLSLRVMRAMKKTHDTETAAEKAGPQWPADKFDDRQRAWCELYERETDYEPQMDDYIAGNETFVEAAEKAITWFEMHTSDQYLRISAKPVPGSRYDTQPEETEA